MLVFFFGCCNCACDTHLLLPKKAKKNQNYLQFLFTDLNLCQAIWVICNYFHFVYCSNITLQDKWTISYLGIKKHFMHKTFRVTAPFKHTQTSRIST